VKITWVKGKLIRRTYGTQEIFAGFLIHRLYGPKVLLPSQPSGKRWVGKWNQRILPCVICNLCQCGRVGSHLYSWVEKSK
jgi:hypothetical protein